MPFLSVANVLLLLLLFVRQIVKQAHEPLDETEIKTLQASAQREKDELLKMQCEQVRESLPSKTERAVELATEKG